jgi:lysophospholipase L1-like esterase
MKPTRTLLLVVGVTLLLASSILLALLLLRGGSGIGTQIRVACIGDSITEGTGYVNDLSELLGGNYSVRNFGVGGATVSRESSKPYMNQTTFQEAEGFQPNIVVVMLGTNDAVATPTGQILNFTNDYEKLISEFQTLASKPEIWLVKPPPIFNDGTGLSTPYFVQEVIPRIEHVANETGLPLIDVYTPLLSHPEYFPDGVHPYGEGAQIIANEVFQAITANVKS